MRADCMLAAPGDVRVRRAQFKVKSAPTNFVLGTALGVGLTWRSNPLKAVGHSLNREWRWKEAAHGTASTPLPPQPFSCAAIPGSAPPAVSAVETDSVLGTAARFYSREGITDSWVSPASLPVR